MTRNKNIKAFCFEYLNYCFEIFKECDFFQKFCCHFQNLRLGVCLAMCLKNPKFEAGCAYKLAAYIKKNVYVRRKSPGIFFLRIFAPFVLI